nr:unnamed protein product [Callosobruchus analis]
MSSLNIVRKSCFSWNSRKIMTSSFNA